MTYIYILERNNIPFYVGKTRHLIRRKHKHYVKYGKDIVLKVIDECKDDRKSIWKPLENKWIQYYRNLGYNILNKNNGGGGPTKYSEESKQKMRKPRREGTGEKISNALKKNNHSQYYTKDVKQHLSNVLKDKSKTFTKKHIENLSKANLLSKGKIVECYDLNDNFIIDFQCLREAKNWLLKVNPLLSINVDKQIKDCCNRRQKTSHGFKWKYKL
jgi:hypothetical protein